ncbi:MAG TPA: DUF2520 domain-containing protein [Terriglobales bacterium]|nr:DUF2520 domain-containing protein [Terriglobales bacterium]
MNRTRALPSISFVGAGKLSTALALNLHDAGFAIDEIVSRPVAASIAHARTISKTVNAHAVSISKAEFASDVTWLCIPDDAIASVAAKMAKAHDWKDKTVFHASGALSAEALRPFRLAGACVASVHPFMTFIGNSAAALDGVGFALEGDKRATAIARRIVRRLGGLPFPIDPQHKAAYHAFGSFCSPLVVALIVAGQEVGTLAGLNPRHARALSEGIVRTTVENAFAYSTEKAFTGPLRRGDVETVRKHLTALQAAPELLAVYRALGTIAVEHLPARQRSTLKTLLQAADG